MKKSGQNSYKQQRKKSSEFENREDYLNHELLIMKFRRWRVHLPFRDFHVELEDLVPALAATIGKVVMVTAMVAAFAAQFGLSPEFVAENVRYELLIAGGIFVIIFSAILNPRANLAGTHGSYDTINSHNCGSRWTSTGVGDFNRCFWAYIKYYQRRF